MMEDCGGHHSCLGACTGVSRPGVPRASGRSRRKPTQCCLSGIRCQVSRRVARHRRQITYRSSFDHSYNNQTVFINMAPDSASINRSLSTIRTELEFLRDSGVLSPPQYQSIMAQLPVTHPSFSPFTIPHLPLPISSLKPQPASITDGPHYTIPSFLLVRRVAEAWIYSKTVIHHPTSILVIQERKYPPNHRLSNRSLRMHRILRTPRILVIQM